jgi:hypothetical protein
MLLGGGDQASGGRLVGVVSGDPYRSVSAAQRGGGLLDLGARPDRTTPVSAKVNAGPAAAGLDR